MLIVEDQTMHETSRSKRLKAATNEMHEALDKRIMQSYPFSSREHYGRFLKVQHRFHRDIDALYANLVLDRLLPDLNDRRRLHLIVQDLADLGMSAPESNRAPVFVSNAQADIPTALGWLYVAEGSNLGAAFLLKEAIKLGLDENSGARHLAPHPSGRGLHWRTFTASLDSLTLNDDEEQRVVAGAKAAFRAVDGAAEEHLV